MRAIQISDTWLNRYYYDAAWAYLQGHPFDDWADLSNIFDGQSFE